MRPHSDVFEKYSETAIKGQLGVQVGENPKESELAPRKQYFKSDLNHEDLVRSKLSKENLERVYRELLGVEPTEKEIEAAVHLGYVLRLGDGDPLWHILLTQQHFASVTADAHQHLQSDIRHVQSLLKAIEKASLEAQGDANLLPASWISRLPVIVRAFFTFSSVKMTLTFTALVLSGLAFYKSSAVTTAAQSDSIRFLTSCFDGRGTIQRQANGQVYCVFRPNTELKIRISDAKND